MRTWLERNKIYFETINNSLLGLMAIIISVVSLYLICRQIDNDELLNQPRIKVFNEVFSYSADTNDSHIIIVTNEGGQLTQFDAQMKTFLKIEYYKEPFNITSDRSILYIPVLDYFSGSIPSNNFQGTIIKFIGVKNLNLLNELDAHFRNKFSEHHPMTFLSLEHYLEIKYVNFRGKAINKTYIVDRVGGGKEIKREGKTKEILSKWDALKGIHLYRLPIDRIKKMIETNGVAN